MPSIPILRDPGQIDTGVRTKRTPQLRAQTNESFAPALEKASEFGFAVVEQSRRANDVAVLTEADLAQKQAEADFAKFQRENPDETGWADKWKEISGAVESSFATKKLTPQAQQQFKAQQQAWMIQSNASVEAQAFKNAGERAKLAQQAAFEYGKRTNEWKPYEDSVNRMVDSGLAPPESRPLGMEIAKTSKQQGNRERYNVRRGAALDSDSPDAPMRFMEAIQQARADDVLTDEEEQSELELAFRMVRQNEIRDAAEKDPVIGLAMVKTGKFGDLNPKAKADAEALMKQSLQRKQAEEMQWVSNLLAAGNIQDVKDIKPHWLDESQKAEIQTVLDKAPMTEQQAASVMVSLEGAIRGYDQKNDPDRLKMLRIQSVLSRMPPGSTSHLTDIWTEKKKGGPMDSKDSYISVASKTIDRIISDNNKRVEDTSGPNKGFPQKGREGEIGANYAEGAYFLEQFKARVTNDMSPAQASALLDEIIHAKAAENAAAHFEALDGGAPLPRNEGTDLSLFPPSMPTFGP